LPILETKIKKIKELEEKVKKAEEEFVLTFPKKEILFFQGWNTIKKVLIKDISNSTSEILLFLRFRKIEPEILEAYEKRINKKVEVKTLGVYSKEREFTMFQYKKIGCKVKTIKDIKDLPLLTFSIFDSKIININFFSEAQKEEGLLVRIEDEITAKLFRKVFLKLWEEAQTL
jgi:pyruvate/2-oxoglutarate dehydrogenase complex dihydrolipoamide acyltransferase (E2) component